MCVFEHASVWLGVRKFTKGFVNCSVTRLLLFQYQSTEIKDLVGFWLLMIYSDGTPLEPEFRTAKKYLGRDPHNASDMNALVCGLFIM